MGFSINWALGLGVPLILNLLARRSAVEVLAIPHYDVPQTLLARVNW
jgi:hypothetical protein